MYVIDIFHQVRQKEICIDLVLMLRRFGKLVLLVCPCLKCSRIVDAEMPRAQSRLAKRLLACQSIGNGRMGTGKDALKSGHTVRRIKCPERYSFLSARCRSDRAVARADNAVVFQIVVDLRIFRIDVPGLLARHCLKIDEILAGYGFAGVRVDRDNIKSERIGREFSDLPNELVAVGRRIDPEAWRQVVYRRSLLGDRVET